MRSHRHRIRRVADRHNVSTLGHIRVQHFAVQAQHHRVLLHCRVLILDHNRNLRTPDHRVSGARCHRQHLRTTGRRTHRRALIHNRSRERVGLDRALHIRVVDQRPLAIHIGEYLNVGSASAFPPRHAVGIQPRLLDEDIKVRVGCSPAAIEHAGCLRQKITKVRPKRRVEPVIRVHTQPVRTSLQLQQRDVLRGNAVGRVAPARDAGQRLVLVTIVRVEVAHRTRRVLVLVHHLHDLRVVAPSLKRINVRLVQVRLLHVRVNVLSPNLSLGILPVVPVQVAHSLARRYLRRVHQEPGLALARLVKPHRRVDQQVIHHREVQVQQLVLPVGILESHLQCMVRVGRQDLRTRILDRCHPVRLRRRDVQYLPFIGHHNALQIHSGLLNVGDLKLPTRGISLKGGNPRCRAAIQHDAQVINPVRLVRSSGARCKQPVRTHHRTPGCRQFMIDHLMSLEVDLQTPVHERDLHIRPLALCPHPHVVPVLIPEQLLLRRSRHTVEILAYHHAATPAALVAVSDLSLGPSPHVDRRGLASAAVPRVKTDPNARARPFLGQAYRVRQVVADADAHPVGRTMIR